MTPSPPSSRQAQSGHTDCIAAPQHSKRFLPFEGLLLPFHRILFSLLWVHIVIVLTYLRCSFTELSTFSSQYLSQFIVGILFVFETGSYVAQVGL